MTGLCRFYRQLPANLNANYSTFHQLLRPTGAKLQELETSE